MHRQIDMISLSTVASLDGTTVPITTITVSVRGSATVTHDAQSVRRLASQHGAREHPSGTAPASALTATTWVSQGRLRVGRNRLTADNEGIQIRLGPDNRWHPYIREGRGTAAAWWPCSPATADPVTALLAARTAVPER